MITFRLHEVRQVRLRVYGPSDTPAPVRVRATPTLAAIIGPGGERGAPGPQGTPGDGATDPGDLTLIFDNQLI